MASQDHVPTLWFDVEDLLRHVVLFRRPSGIQRLSFEIYHAFKDWTAGPYEIGFVRHAPDNQFQVVDWAQVAVLFDHAEAGTQAVELETVAPPASSLPDPPPSGHLDRLRRLSRRVPDRFRRPALQFAAMQVQAGLALGTTATSIAREATRGLQKRLRPDAVQLPHAADSAEPDIILLAQVARRGDVLASIGSPWFDDDYAGRVAFAGSRLGMRTAILVYDMIPVHRPEWCSRGTTRVFRNWYTTVLPLTDVIFAISSSTSRDLLAWCSETGVSLGADPVVIPVGSGFKAAHAVTDQDNRVAARLGISRSYVLFVSTIEVRKNHILLFRVWQRLLEEMPASTVPELVLVGKEGWLVKDFMQQVANSRQLDGKLRIINDASDDELVGLYKGCLFTVFPSFYEGWGLPVTEALAFGKPCIAANVSSIPEAGGDLARYFDPGNLNEAVETIRTAITDEAGLAVWTRQVQESFRPVAWAESARVMAAALTTVDLP